MNNQKGNDKTVLVNISLLIGNLFDYQYAK